MINGSEVRKADYPINSIFVDRWSPRAMSGEEISVGELMMLLEAARWAPSSYNNQPWRIIFARRDTAHWPKFLNLLNTANRLWAANAGALLAFISKTTLDRDGSDSRTHSFDTGAAWVSLALQGFMSGYVVHGMQGINYEKAKIDLEVPDGFKVEMMAAVGIPGNVELLPEVLREKEMPSDRKSLSEIVSEGSFGKTPG